MSDMVLRVAAKAVIVNDEGKVLIVREATSYSDGTQHGRYGLPGGRLDIGERFEDGLRREVLEEVGLKIEALYPVFIGEWRPNIHGVSHQIIAIFIACRAKTTNVTLSDEHDKAEWINPADRNKYAIMDPDGEVIDTYATRFA